MAWIVEFENSARKEFKKLDFQAQKKILRFLRERITTDEDPRRFGEPLKGNWTNFWKYRIGDYRVICNIQDERMLVLVVRVRHRSKAYQR